MDFNAIIHDRGAINSIGGDRVSGSLSGGTISGTVSIAADWQMTGGSVGALGNGGQVSMRLHGGTVNGNVQDTYYSITDIDGTNVMGKILVGMNSNFTMESGSVSGNIDAIERFSKVNIKGGRVGGNVVGQDLTNFFISGGTFGGVVSTGVDRCDTGETNLWGCGAFAAISGGSFGGKEFDRYSTSGIGLTGTNMTAVFSRIGTNYMGEIGAIWNLSGQLADGSDLTGYRYWQSGTSTTDRSGLALGNITLSVPEPSIVSGFLGTGVWFALAQLKRRTKSNK